MTDNNLYRCLFYHSRRCSVREQIGLTDKKIQNEINDFDTSNYSAVDSVFNSYLDRMKSYCDVCPHLSPVTKLEKLTNLLNTTTDISHSLKKLVEDKITKILER